ncbi:hypothetical protein GCM10009850_091490 [Nonomuraea monospora]|uniref:Uncharacterized protein n=1 Tax=Nonomuraea monospora TaxID=568818 RepID=A0ABN3CW14_9ACTN
MLTGAGQAHASPDPIKSLRKQFAEGRGVRVSETTRDKTSKVKDLPPTRTTGTIELGSSGAGDYDLTSRWKITPPPADEIVGFEELEGPFASQENDEPLTLDRGDLSAR